MNPEVWFALTGPVVFIGIGVLVVLHVRASQRAEDDRWDAARADLGASAVRLALPRGAGWPDDIEGGRAEFAAAAAGAGHGWLVPRVRRLADEGADPVPLLQWRLRRAGYEWVAAAVPEAAGCRPASVQVVAGPDGAFAVVADPGPSRGYLLVRTPGGARWQYCDLTTPPPALARRLEELARA